jgi:cobaltochelatase CobT
MDYKIFTTEHDEIVDMGDWRQEYEEAARRDGEEDLFTHCGKQLDEYIAIHMGDVPEMAALEGGSKLVFLVDCSGSMRGSPIVGVITALAAAGDALNAAGRDFEILGFTTKSWKGGAPKLEHAAAGFPKDPGRLNELRHIVIKDMDTSWEHGRKNLNGLLIDGLAKEDVPGEAVQWAESRILERGFADDETLVFISDDKAVCDVTLRWNGKSYLDDHLAEVIDHMRRPEAEVGFYQVPTALKIAETRSYVSTKDYIEHYLDQLGHVVAMDEAHEIPAPKEDYDVEMAP